MSDDLSGLRDKLAKSSEETLGKFAQELLENPLVTGALTRAFAARERAAGAQEAAMGALNIPSAADVERLTRRLRAVGQRLEGIEDALDRLDRRLEKQPAADEGDASLQGVQDGLAALTQEVRRLSAAVEAGDERGPVAVPREQERLEVSEKPAAKAKPAAKKKAAAKRKPAAKA